MDSVTLMLVCSPDFPTIDPAPSLAPQSVPELRAALLNTQLPLFERYRAMFALRDFGAGSREAVHALADGFGDDSALFRYAHQIPQLLRALVTR
jgi:deoxyhypusine monooxygenase